jgi:hypothetical protein
VPGAPDGRVDPTQWVLSPCPLPGGEREVAGGDAIDRLIPAGASEAPEHAPGRARDEQLVRLAPKRPEELLLEALALQVRRAREIRAPPWSERCAGVGKDQPPPIDVHR